MSDKTITEYEEELLVEEFDKFMPNEIHLFNKDEKVYLMRIIQNSRFMKIAERNSNLQEAIDALNEFLKTTIVEYDVERKTFYKGERAIFSMKKNGKLVQRNYQLPPSVMKKICEFYESEGSK